MSSNQQVQYQAMTPVIDNQDEVYDFIDNPVITLKDAQGESIDITLLNHYHLMAKILLARK